MEAPLPREELDSIIEAGLAEYDEAVRAEWERVRLEPVKWRCSPWGDEGGGFWAVAILERQVLWFNDIEEGFNLSRFSETGIIDEYLCNQTTFVEILEQIAQAQARSVIASLPPSDVPAEMRGPGTIVHRQTTYWDLESATGAVCRVYFEHKAEFRFAEPNYPDVEVESRHPLLVDHEDPFRSMYFLGRPTDPDAVAARLDLAIRQQCEGWRAVDDYAGGIEKVAWLLRQGSGHLMAAPRSVCIAASAVLEVDGVKTSVLGEGSYRGNQRRLLLLGRSYVIAEGFRFGLGEAKAKAI